MKKLLGLLAAAAVFAAGCGGHCRGDRMERYSGKLVKKLASKLDLDDSQKAKLEAVRATVLAKHAEMKGKREGRLNEVLGLIRAEKFDQGKASAMIEAAHTARAEAKDKLLAQVAEFHASLKPEQREKLAKLVEDKAKCYLK